MNKILGVFDEEHGEAARGYFWELDNPITRDGKAFVMYLPKKWCMATTVHESLHATYSILKYCKIPIGYANEEIICFTLEYIVEAIYDICYKGKNR